MAERRIGILTSGGDTPGMNAAIRAVVRCAAAVDVETIGIRFGYRGLMLGDFVPLSVRDVGGILTRGGTVLGSARAPDFRTVEGRQQALDKLSQQNIGGLVVIGGNGSQSGAHALHEMGLPTVGVASTIDNDLRGFDTSIGVDTALNTAISLVDRLRDTASSHRRAFVVETMGRQSGYLALMTGIATGAELILTPEQPVDIAQAEAALKAAYGAGKSHFLVVAAEGCLVSAADVVEALSAVDNGAYEVRLSVLGHIQRGGSPSAFDRLLASRSGAAAVDAFVSGASGVTSGLARGRIGLVPMEEAIQPAVKVTPELCGLAEKLAR